MKPLSAALPAGLSPEPAPAPVPCVFCQQGHWVRDGSHYRISERGVELLGACLAPKPKAEIPKVQAAPKRSHEECLSKLKGYADRGSAVSALVEARETFTSRSQPEEDDE